MKLDRQEVYIGERYTLAHETRYAKVYIGARNTLCNKQTDRIPLKHVFRVAMVCSKNFLIGNNGTVSLQIQLKNAE